MMILQINHLKKYLCIKDVVKKLYYVKLGHKSDSLISLTKHRSFLEKYALFITNRNIISFCDDWLEDLHKSSNGYFNFFSNLLPNFIASSMKFQGWYHIELAKLLFIQCTPCIYIWIILRSMIMLLSLQFDHLTIQLLHWNQNWLHDNTAW